MISTMFEWLKTGGLPFLFFLVLVEGNPLIGSFIPGQVIVIFVGFLISTTQIYNLYATLIIVFVASFLGDALGYYLGRKYGVSGLKLLGMSDKTKVYKSSYKFFKKYGPWSLILGREFNFTRAFMPFFAGCFGMSYFTFIIYALVSCFIWTIVSVALGYYFGFIIIDNFGFIMEFVLFLVLYFLFVGFVYKNVKIAYHENFNVIKRYALHNLVFLGTLITVVISMGYLIKWGYHDFINDQLWFLYFSGLYVVLGFLTTKPFLITLALFIFIYLFVRRQFRMLTVYTWSMVFFLFLNFIVTFFMKIWYGVKLDYAIISYTFLIFFLWVLFRMFIKNQKKLKYSNLFIVILVSLVILSEFSYHGNIFIVLISFLVGVIESEIMLLLSHYQILDSCLSECRYDKDE